MLPPTQLTLSLRQATQPRAVAPAGELAPAICLDCGRPTAGATICVPCSADAALELPPPPRRNGQCQGFDANGNPCKHQTPRGGKDAYCRPCARQVKANAQILPRYIPEGWQPQRFAGAPQR